MAIDTRGPVYRGYLLALAVVPLIGLVATFERVQKVYAIFGALFMPMLGATLLVLNGRSAWVGRKMRNSRAIVALLLATLLLFSLFGYLALRGPSG